MEKFHFFLVYLGISDPFLAPSFWRPPNGSSDDGGYPEKPDLKVECIRIVRTEKHQS